MNEAAVATVPDGDTAPEVDTLIVKLASRCNLNCDYCYFYHGADQSWSAMPRRMSDTTIAELIATVRWLHQVQHTPPLVVLHGGEPLLFGIGRTIQLIDELLMAVPNARISLQTNGTIYNDTLEAALVRLRENVTFSVSVDGFQRENDRHRLDHKGESRWEQIAQTLGRARRAEVLDGILMVVDVDSDPASAYAFMHWAGASSYDLLLPDGDRNTLPPGKAGIDSTVAGAWLWHVFALYARDNPPFRIRILDEMALAVLARQADSHSGGGPPRCVLTVDTDGELKQVDTLRVNAAGQDCLNGGMVSIQGVEAALASPRSRALLAAQDDLADECRSCAYLSGCGGGYLQHRHHSGSYRHPSIYCADYKLLFARLEAALWA